MPNPFLLAVDAKAAFNEGLHVYEPLCTYRNSPKTRHIQPAETVLSGWQTVMRGSCTPHQPPIVAIVAGIQAQETSLTSGDVYSSLRDSGLERDGFTNRHFPQNLTGPCRERVNLARGGPHKCLAINDTGRSKDALHDGGLFVIMQCARPNRFAGLRIDALSAVAHRAIEATIVDERLRPLICQNTMHARLPDIHRRQGHWGRSFAHRGEPD